jgi:glycosyltransferase involved in cell wall biosynthesis
VSAPELSVVICSRNGAPTLAATLDHVERQSLERSRYEVIVVDDGSTDATAEIARVRGARVVSLTPGRGLAAARNAGVRSAAAPVIAFTDDDCRPDRGWLAALARVLCDPSVDGVGGRVVPICTSGFLVRYLRVRNPLTPLGSELLSSSNPRYRLRLYLRGVLAPRPEPPPGAPLYSVVGANMALRRELVTELGGFDEAFVFGGEEQDLCLRARGRPRAAVFRYEPRAVVGHVFRASLIDTLRRARAYGVGHARTAVKCADVHLILYPFPLLTASAMVLASLRHRRGLALLATLVPLLVYMRWPRSVWKAKSVEPLAYPYLQLAEEVAAMLGELQGLREGYHRNGAVPAREAWASATGSSAFP